jgi:hypothetical protein
VQGLLQAAGLDPVTAHGDLEGTRRFVVARHGPEPSAPFPGP